MSYWINPRVFINPKRLDVIVKYLFFRSLQNRVLQHEYRNLYLKHIFYRTKGIEPADRYSPVNEGKYKIDDYVLSAQRLFESLKVKYDINDPIPVGRHGGLLNGAHRVAASLCLDRSVSCEKFDEEETSWDFEWFCEHEFTTEDKQRILMGYTELTRKPYAVFVLWGPIVDAWDETMLRISCKHSYIGHVDFDFSYSDIPFVGLVREVYGDFSNDQISPISRKIALLQEYPRKIRVIVVEPNEQKETCFYEDVNDVKKSVRGQLSFLTSDLMYVSFHASSSLKEARHLASILLSVNNVRHLFLRLYVVRHEYVLWLMRLRHELKKQGVDTNSVCIVGSSPLEVVGIRHSTDVDIVVSSRMRNTWISSCNKIADGIDIVSEHYHRKVGADGYSDDLLIESKDLHFLFCGFKHVNIDVVRDRKQYQRRDKDLQDLDSIDLFFRQALKHQLSPFPDAILTQEIAYRDLLSRIENVETMLLPWQAIRKFSRYPKIFFAFLFSRLRSG